MQRWMLLNRSNRFFEENNWEDSTGGEDNATDNQDTPNDWAGKKEEDSTSIPKYRFDEVNEKRKQAEAELAKYKEAEKKQAEDEALKKWEYEKIISQKDQELAELKKQQEAWKTREETVSKRNQERVAKLEEDKDFWGNAKSLIDGVSDPFDLSSKLDALEAMHSSNKASGKASGGSDVPSGWKDSSRLAELQKKANSWVGLTQGEQLELMRLAREKSSK